MITPLNHAIDWSRVGANITLSAEEQQIVQMLAAKKSLPDIGKALGQHRSMIWRKVERIKARLDATM
jgi:DNA-binding CsgD family transcriptional regulator